ncbi:Parallel beta-helix repeat protein OS=Blastopirellula marina DSM 3645 GN=DSM3645_28792 PE=4 SV=1 [Gemmataceae bacterium]|nr:Parallel beta-helix repeat protein OS=Blastopirellula marina DSM 3645 GN=DSM3645_28792 PE=4 SV=1 [Gemmataceae bacterium]VTT96555.1 Parallel beta-helix repeat protein OS=Blastopirellula marina DSM 3645 GN=DSM3645_28792 PE=4 SV=1 [Gemmataceae bacterium]
MPGIVNWVGRQRKRAQVDTITVGSFANGTTFITTVGAKAFTYTAATGVDTSAAVLTTNLLAALGALDDPEFTELTFAAGATNTTIKVTGPDDGKPFTLACSGTGTYNSSTTTAPLSPSDWTDPVNFDTGALPTTGDTAVIGNTAVPVLWNLGGNTDVFTVRRVGSHTGRVGLPDTSDVGYPEYRPTHLEVAGTTVFLQTNGQDQAGAVRVKCTAGSAAAYTVTGVASAVLDAEPVEVTGLFAGSTLGVLASGVAVSPLDGQTGAVLTLTGEQAAVRWGAGATVGDVVLKNCQWRGEASVTTLQQLESGSGTMARAAACGNAGLKVLAGSVAWRSTGATGNSPVVGVGATLDFSEAPGSVAVGGTVELNAGGSWIDPRHACGSYNLKFNRCRPTDVSFQPGTDRTVAVT